MALNDEIITQLGRALWLTVAGLLGGPSRRRVNLDLKHRLNHQPNQYGRYRIDLVERNMSECSAYVDTGLPPLVVATDGDTRCVNAEPNLNSLVYESYRVESQGGTL